MFSNENISSNANKYKFVMNNSILFYCGTVVYAADWIIVFTVGNSLLKQH